MNLNEVQTRKTNLNNLTASANDNMHSSPPIRRAKRNRQKKGIVSVLAFLFMIGLIVAFRRISPSESESRLKKTANLFLSQPIRRVKETTPFQTTKTIAIGGVFKQETPYIIEWIEYHKLIGVNRFFLFSNDCDKDDTLNPTVDLLQPYIESNLIKFSVKFICEGTGFQGRAFTDALSLANEEGVEWLAMVDLDEFIVVADSTKLLPEILVEYYEGHNAVGMMWRVFGTSGHELTPSGSVISNYRNRAVTNSRDNRSRSFKSIVRAKSCKQFSVHMCSQFDTNYCKEKGMEMSSVSIPRYGRGLLGDCDCTIAPDLSQCLGEKTLQQFDDRPKLENFYMHHYRTKSVEEYLKKKERGRAATPGKLTDGGGPNEEYNAYYDEKLVVNVKARLEGLGLAEKERLTSILLTRGEELKRKTVS